MTQSNESKKEPAPNKGFAPLSLVKSAPIQDWRKRMNARMKELGISQVRLSEELGMHQSAINHYANGRREPTLDILERIAKTLRMSPEELITGVDPVKAKLLNQIDAHDLRKLIVDFNYKKMLEEKLNREMENEPEH
jgi:transcriptional regulator with XRE-family HTH domain